MDLKEFSKRRKNLMQMIEPDGIVILPTATEKTRSNDTHYRYRPDSDFYYLTGFHEPEALAVLLPVAKGQKRAVAYKFILFCRDKDPLKETWDGRRVGPKAAIKEFGADEAYSIHKVDELLPKLIGQCERVYYTMGNDAEFDKRMIGWVNETRGNRNLNEPHEFVSLNHYLHEMRLFKSTQEIKVMRQSARIAVAAHKRAMLECQPGMNEYEIEAEFDHEYKRNGATHSYTPIIAGGENACILHYNENDQELKDGDLLLIDAGAELDMYASDITRTFPVNGQFSDAQKEIYDIVLAAQEAAFEEIYVGNHWLAPHEAAVKAVAKGLQKLGILKGRLPDLIKQEAYFKFFMHKTGHWIGMDVHDVGDYKVEEQWREFEAGMVLTVEPGIYIPKGTRGVDKKYWGIGVRIEDDVLVTRKGYDILTKGLPRTTDEVEALMAKGRAQRASLQSSKKAA